jgi:hypothetical protein
MNMKHAREQDHHNRTILKMTRDQFFEQKKITFWDGDKDSGEWRKDVMQCSPVDMIEPYGLKAKKISGVIARLREHSPYFVLEESRIKRDECAFVGKNKSYITVRQLTGFVTFRGKEYVRLKWSNKKHEEWVEKSAYVQERPSSERKRQKPDVLTSSKIGELSNTPSERNDDVTDIVLSDKQEALLMEIYPKMRKEAAKLVEEGLHRDAFDAVHREICFERSVDYWTRELINAYDNVIRNIYYLEVEGHPVDFLDEIEREDSLKVYASVWEVDDDGELVKTKDGKAVLNKEPSASLLKIMGDLLCRNIFLMVQMGTSRSLAEAHKLARKIVFTKMNEDRSFYESRGSWKKVKGDLETDAPRKLADLSLMWEKMTGSTRGTISECKGHEPNALIKGALISGKADAIKKVCVKKRERTKCCIESCSSYVHPICKDKKFCYKHAKAEHKKKCANCHKNLAQVGGGLCRGCFGGKAKAKQSLRCKICKLNTASRIGGKCAGCLDVKCFDVKKKRVRKRKPKKCLGKQGKRQKT